MRLWGILVLVGACSPAGEDPRSGGTGAGAIPPPYVTVMELHEKAMSRTCSLNGGVCHNSKEYPDLHSVSNLLDTMMQPCNVAAMRHSDVHDACESEGDHLVSASLGIDVEVASVAYDLVRPTLTLAADVTATGMAGDAEIRRGSLVFALPGSVATVTGARTISLDLSAAPVSAPSFFDDRVYPWNESMIRVGDVNGNGVLGHTLGMGLVVPGRPDKSYLLQRLVDDSQGDLMPRQCREWTQTATRALGCWIEGLAVDGAGFVTNATEPIDYEHCHFDPGARGRCVDNLPAGSLAAVEAVFARNCAGAGCHINETNPRAGLDLSPGHAWASLVGARSTEVPSLVRVAAGNPDASYLTCKVGEACAQRSGERMPLGAAALSDADLTAIKTWILAGAPPH